MHKLHSHLPEFLSSIYEFDELLKAEQIEVDALRYEAEKIEQNAFVNTADEYGLTRFEKLYGISSSSHLSPEERRFILKSVMADNVPVTLNSLKNLLSGICGESGYSVEIDRYTINISLVLPSVSSEKAVKAMLSRIIPANMVLNISVDYSDIMKMRLGG